MERLFSEIYNRYFVIANRILSKKKLSRNVISDTVRKYGFAESLLFLLPKLADNEWELFDEENGAYIPKIKGGIHTPLSRLQRRWLKAALADPRAGLFLDNEQIRELNKKLSDTEVLFDAKDFCYFDRFSDGDNYNDTTYRECFRQLLKAAKEKSFVCITYSNKSNRKTKISALPHRIEYSIKNDCFRVLCYAKTNNGMHRYILRISRMISVIPAADDTSGCDIDETDISQKKVTLTIFDERNAMERAMLQFADYRKNTMRIDDNSYRCEIFYNSDDETELLIELLSFGPMIKVEGDEHFVELIKKRLKKQAGYTATNERTKA